MSQNPREQHFRCSEMCGRYATPVFELITLDFMFYCIDGVAGGAEMDDPC